MRRFHKQHKKWANPEASVGDYRGMKNKKKCWEAKTTSPASDALKSLHQRIDQILTSSCSRVPKSSLLMFDIFMIGDTPDTSIPHIMFSCARETSRAEAVKEVKKSGILNEFPGLYVGHWPFPPHIENLQTTSDFIADEDEKPTTVEFLPVTECVENNEHPSAIQMLVNNSCWGPNTQKKATIGATVRIGWRTFHFAPAHVFLDDKFMLEDEEQGDGRSEADTCEFGGFSDAEESIDDAFVEIMSQGSRSPTPDNEASDLDTKATYLSASSEEVDKQTYTRHTPEVVQHIPQLFDSGAWNRLDECFFISSTFDYALLNLSRHTIPFCKLSVLSEDTVARISSREASVTVITGSSGLVRGTLNGRPSFMHLPYSGTYQDVYPVFLSGTVQLGDSGAIVQDEYTKKIYGHIVAGSIESKVAFIIPAVQVMADLRKEFGLSDAENIEHSDLQSISARPSARPSTDLSKPSTPPPDISLAPNHDQTIRLGTGQPLTPSRPSSYYETQDNTAVRARPSHQVGSVPHDQPIAEQLLDNEADTEANNVDSQTPLSWATRNMDGLNECRTARVAEVLADYRTLNYYIAAAPTEPVHTEDYYTEGWTALRQCILDNQHLLFACVADAPVLQNTSTEEDRTKSELKHCLLDAYTRRHVAQKIYLRQAAAQRWAQYREQVLQGQQRNSSNGLQLRAFDEQLRSELSQITDVAIYQELQASDRALGRWTAEDPSLTVVQSRIQALSRRT